MDTLEGIAISCECCAGESHVLVNIDGKLTWSECAYGRRERACE
jgi:hypothetical protein